MADVLTKKQRSFNMSRIRGKNTMPEMIVRSLVHRMGYRYSLHKRNLLGQPDLVFTRHRKIIFVHGCFWHMHKCRYGKVIPQTRKKFWQTKRQGNVARDRKNIRELKKTGWKVLVVWECQIRDLKQLSAKLIKFLKS
jgi:DNA mismatch endonuclease (patch repair protein)